MTGRFILPSNRPWTTMRESRVAGGDTKTLPASREEAIPVAPRSAIDSGETVEACGCGLGGLVPPVDRIGVGIDSAGPDRARCRPAGVIEDGQKRRLSACSRRTKMRQPSSLLS